MKGERGGTVSSFLLLMASAYARAGIDDASLRTSIPDDLTFSGDTLDPLGSFDKGLFFNGVLWDLSPEGQSSSSSKVMPPKVSCIQEGFFHVTGSCHEFYYCQDLTSQGLEDWNIFWFTCQEGLVFDIDSQKCVNHSLITGHPECQHEKEELKLQMVDFGDDKATLEDSSEQDAAVDAQLTRGSLMSRDFFEQKADDEGGVGLSGNFQIPYRKKRSLATLEESGEKMVDIIAQTANEACIDIRNIDNYVKQIISKKPLEIPSNIDEFYSQNMKHYNYNLKIAKRNTGSWKEKNGILAAIKETFSLTREFEPKFSERFRRMEKRVATVLEGDKHKIEELENELVETEHLIAITEDGLQKTVNVNVTKFILRSIQENLVKLKNDHRRLVKEYDEAKKEAEFQDLVQILEYVKANSIEIREKVEDTRLKIEDFQRNTQTDLGNFKRVRQLAASGKQFLQQRREENNKKLAEANTQRASLRSNIVREENSIRMLNSQLRSTREDLRQEKRRLERDIEEAKKKQIAGGILLVFMPVVGATLLGVGSVDRKNAISRKEATVRHYENEIRGQESQVRRLYRGIDSTNDRIAHLEVASRALQRDLLTLQSVDNGLQNLQNNVNSILPFLAKAIASLERMKELFLSTEFDLDKLINAARTAHTRALERIFSYFMYFELEKLRKHWENARDRIISVGECITSR